MIQRIRPRIPVPTPDLAARASHPAARAPAAASRASPSAARPAPREESAPVRRTLEGIERQRAAIDQAIREAARGRSFSPAELVVLQARVFEYAQSLEVLSQLVDKSVGAVKAALNTQL